jgi:CheY-like chemotaxis protein
MGKQRVMFIDDEQSILDGLRRMLRDQDGLWEMHFFNRPMDALQQMRQETFDAAVVDISMPGMTGLDFLSEVKSDPRICSTEVIILTGLLEDSLKRQALNGGASDLLNKPIQKEDLLARLRSALRGKALRDELARQHAEAEQQKLAAQRVELIGALSGQAVHSLHEIMTSLLWYGDLAHQMLVSTFLNAEDAASIQEALTAISSAGERARQLLEYILRLSTSGGEVRQPCDISLMTLDVAKLMPGVLPKGVVVESSASEHQLLVYADPAMLFQLLLNLALFSTDSIEPDHKLSLTVEPAVAAPQLDTHDVIAEVQEEVQITVQTTGAGPSNNSWQELILGKSGAPWTPGRGAADLSIARRITESLGGTLQGHADPRGGMRFIVHLPRLLKAAIVPNVKIEQSNA